MLPEWFERKRAAARAGYASKKTPRLAYGLTIRLNSRALVLDGNEATDSEQVVTLEHEDCRIASLFDMLNDPQVRQHLFSTEPAERTRMDDFSDAFFDIGLVVIVPPGKDATLTLTRTITSQVFNERTLILCGKGSTLTLIDRYQGDCTLRAGVVEAILEDDATLRYASVQHLGKDAVDLSSYRARCGKDAKADWFVASIGSALSRAEVSTRLAGDGGKARSYGVFLGDGTQQFDLSAATFHEGDHTESDMYTRGVLDGKSKAVYRGTIDIAANANGCDGYQKEETLLVSPDAAADAIPNLEIRNNDVRCSHGATIGRVDEEQLFYLTSRGIPRNEAVRMLIEGYFEPLTTRLDWPALFEQVKPLVEAKIA